MAGKKGKSGGKRANSGPKPKEARNFSIDVKNRVLKAAEELAKEYGEPIEKAFMRLLYSDNIQDTVKASVAKWYADILVIKESETTTTHKTKTTPEIYLPKEREDPAKIIPIDGGKSGKNIS